MIVKAPAAVAVLDEIDPACAISTVRVVVPGEEVAVVIEDELLRVAEPCTEEL